MMTTAALSWGTPWVLISPVMEARPVVGVADCRFRVGDRLKAPCPREEGSTKEDIGRARHRYPGNIRVRCARVR